MTTGFGFCPNCGTPLVSVGQKFCIGCGHAFAGAVPAGTVVPLGAVKAPEPVKSKSEADIELPNLKKIEFTVFGSPLKGVNLMYIGLGVCVLGLLFGLLQYRFLGLQAVFFILIGLFLLYVAVANLVESKKYK